MEKEVINPDYLEKINEVQKHRLFIESSPLRVMSFNMLFDLYDHNLSAENRWDIRQGRIKEYLLYAKPDIVGSQELQPHQIDDVMEELSDMYTWCGEPAIFYNRERLELLEAFVYHYSCTPCQPSHSPHGKINTAALATFYDRETGCQFTLINTHLCFGHVNQRKYEACFLEALIRSIKGPLIVTGDFNTFPNRQELDLPFYDGDDIIVTIEKGGVKDSQLLSRFGHFGPIASTNFCNKKKESFVGKGTPGVILDHIFVSDQIEVLTHGIDPATVDERYPSDHFPVIIELTICQG